MSKSYKKNIIKYAPRGNHGKKQANKRVRQIQDIPSGKTYKKVYNTHNVHDNIYDGRWEDIEMTERRLALGLLPYLETVVVFKKMNGEFYKYT